MKLATLFFIVLVSAACQPTCPDVPVSVAKPCPTVADAGAPAPLPATCAGLCAHRAALGCETAKPTKEGASCEAVCENAVTSGEFKLNLACRVAAASCAAEEACPAK